MISEILSQYLPRIFDGILRGLVLTTASLGVVYIFGRMLEIINSNRARNALAIFVMFPMSYWIVIVYDISITNQLEILLRALFFGLVGCIFFVVIGWHFYDRIDHLLDTKIAPDQRKKKNDK